MSSSGDETSERFEPDPMSAPSLSQAEWHQLRYQIASTGLGTADGVVCGDCHGTIDAGDRTKAYLSGHGDEWAVRRVLHPDCSEFFTVDAIGDHDEQEGIVFGTLQHAPEIARQAADDRSAADVELRAIFGDDLTTIKTDLTTYHLTDLTLGAVFISQRGELERIADD